MSTFVSAIEESKKDVETRFVKRLKEKETEIRIITEDYETKLK